MRKFKWKKKKGQRENVPEILAESTKTNFIGLKTSGFSLNSTVRITRLSFNNNVVFRNSKQGGLPLTGWPPAKVTAGRPSPPPPPETPPRDGDQPARLRRRTLGNWAGATTVTTTTKRFLAPAARNKLQQEPHLIFDNNNNNNNNKIIILVVVVVFANESIGISETRPVVVETRCWDSRKRDPLLRLTGFVGGGVKNKKIDVVFLCVDLFSVPDLWFGFRYL